jgi:hypothetical protein
MIKRSLAALACAGASLAAPAQADVVLVEFSGTISTSVLPSSWIGRTVRGTVSIDLQTGPPPLYWSDSFSQIGTTSAHPFAGWIEASVHQPDGSTIVIASGPAPVPYPVQESNDAYTHIYNDYASRDAFYLQRTFSNGGDSYPQQQFVIDVMGLNAFGLLSTANYLDIRTFDLSQANYANHGIVLALTGPTTGYNYAFTLQSLKASVVPAPVPEPATWLLMLAGVGALFVRSPAPRREWVEQIRDSLR